ncbi:MAG: hypothetical protein ACE5NC_00785 [Anaerolineae bacterium]
MRKFLTLLVAGLLVALIPVSLYAFNLQRILLGPDIYRDVLASDRVYETLVDYLGHTAAGLLEEEGGGILVASADLEDLQALVSEALPPDWFESQIQANVAALFGWLDSDRPLPDLVINLREVKPRLVPVFRHAVLLQWEGLPQCSGDGPPLLDDAGSPICRPPGMSLQRFLNLAGVALDNEIAEGLRQVPDRVTLADLMADVGEDTSHELEEALERVRTLLNMIRLGTLVLVSATIVTFVILALLAATSARSLLGWTGGTLVAGGLAAALPALAAPNLVHRVSDAIARGGDAEVRAAAGLVESALAPLAEGVASAVISQSLVVTAVGAMAVAGGIVLRLLPRSAAPAISPTSGAEPEQAG